MQEPFTAAETLKKGKGFVSLGGVYADPEDADAARISKLIRATMTRLHVDINRSIAYYRTTLGGAPPKRVFLTGGSSQLPYLDLFIGDKLNLPVTYFNPLRNVNLAPSLNTSYLQQNHCFTAELVGLALRQTGSAPAEIRLDAPTLAARTATRHKMPYFVTALVAWALLFVCLGLYYYQQTVVAQNKTAEIRDHISGLKSLAPGVTKLAKQQVALQQTLDTVAALGDQRDAWAQVFAAINEKIPDGVWITSLTPAAVPSNQRGGAPPPSAANSGLPKGFVTPTGEVDAFIIQGLYHAHAKTEIVDPSRLRDFVVSLADVPYFSIDKNKITDTLTSFGTVDTYPDNFAQSFTMTLKLKTPISLRP